MRDATRSVFVSAAVITNCQCLEHATLVAGSIGRAAAVFRFDEVVVLDEDSRRGEDSVSKSAALLARLLQYQETPQYLRKKLIPIHDDFRFVGSCPPLDAPHHQRSTEWTVFREGVVRAQLQNVSLIDIGLEKEALVRQKLRVGARVTVKLGDEARNAEGPNGAAYAAELCLRHTPVEELGQYWGFSVRIAHGLSSVFLDCPYDAGYDLVIGTSEHGDHVQIEPHALSLLPCAHLLIGFGGPAGLEDCCRKDPQTQNYQIRRFCHYYLNTCPDQGSRTIRTEEAVWMALSYISVALRTQR